MSHCPGCAGSCYADLPNELPKVITCPGITCPDCADAAEWHKAIMAEPCEGDVHCTCVPVLRKACAEKDAEIATLEAATRKVVEALRIARQYVTPFTYDMEQCDLALADPTLVALRRE